MCLIVSIDCTTKTTQRLLFILVIIVQVRLCEVDEEVRTTGRRVAGVRRIVHRQKRLPCENAATRVRSRVSDVEFEPDIAKALSLLQWTLSGL